ncbi:glycosyltransferase family 2 protein [Companilactobacillus sp. DQM5]|uniref:glycosyltransferase family 2 protein n=1 Tax=Companilactobacillus sp. DQM5 TaxID=3463359 RepID=UPI0040593667
MNNDIKVSIIIPTYNNEETIRRAVKSCQSQTYKDIEIIVVDNGSIDKTNKQVSDLAKEDDRIILVRLEKKGRSNARNYGLDTAKGKYIQFLDADDTLSIDKIEKSINFFIQNKKIDAYAMSAEYVKENKKRKYTPTIRYKDELLEHNVFPINSFVFKANKLRFDKTIEYDEDWLFWIELFYKEKFKWFIDEQVGCSVYITGENTMSDTAKMMYYEVLIRGMVKIKYNVKSFKIFLSDIKKVIITYLLFEQNKINNTQLNNIKKYFTIEDVIGKILFKIPFIHNKAKSKLLTISKNNEY